MTATVTWVTGKGDKAAIMKMSDDTAIWTPDKALADTLVGKEIPADWTLKQGEYGPQAFPPRDKKSFGGAPAAFRNTKEGQAVEQDMMNRRTALMQAAQFTPLGLETPKEAYVGIVLATAYEFYAWLSGAAVATVSDNGEVKAPVDAPEAQASPSTSEGVAEEYGEGSKATLPGHVDPKTCPHEMTSPLSPGGKPLKENRLRCLDCGLVFETADA